MAGPIAMDQGALLAHRPEAEIQDSKDAARGLQIPSGGASGVSAGVATELAVGASEEPSSQAAIITEDEAGRLLLGLERLHADYEATVAAGQERLAGAAADSGDEASSEPGAVAEGYVALGSDDGQSCADSSDEEAQGPLGASKTCEPMQEQLGAATAAATSGDCRSAAQQDVVPVLEDFADFSPNNLALPLPPAETPSLMAAPLTRDQVRMIRQTMSRVCPPPPPWARNLPDNTLERMVRKLAEPS